MFLFNIQRFGGGTSTTNIPATYADRSEFPGLDTATNQQLDYNSLASLLSTGLLQQALAASGYKVNQTQQGTSNTSTGSSVGNNSLNKLNYSNLPKSVNTSADNSHSVNNWDEMVKAMIANRNDYGSVDEWRNENIKNNGWTVGSNGLGKYYGYGSYNNSEEIATAIADEAQKRLYGTGQSSDSASSASTDSTYSMDTSSRITPDYKSMYDKGMSSIDSLLTGYGTSSQGYIDKLNALVPQWDNAMSENDSETRALEARYNANAAEQAAENKLMRGRYDTLATDSTGRSDKSIADYNTKLDSLQQGIIPTAFTDVQQRILNRSANEAVGTLLSTLGQSGSINSSLGRKGIGDISYNVVKEMDDSYLSNIDRLASMAKDQYSNQNTANTNYYDWNKGSLDANSALIQSIFDNNNTSYKSIGELIQNRFNNKNTGLTSQANTLGNTAGLNQKQFDTQMAGVSAPMQYAAASQEAQDASLYKLINGANAANQYPFNFWSANNSAWSNMNTPEQTVVTQNEGFGSALGGLAGLVAKFIK